MGTGLSANFGTSRRGALPLAEEADLPTLVRALMQTLTAASTGRVLRGLRAQLGAVGAETLAATMRLPDVIVRVMADGATPRRPASPLM